MDAVTLHDAIAEVSPIINASVGKSDDRATWKWTPDSGATQSQIDAGNNVIATISIETKNISLSAEEFISRWTNEEYVALEMKRRTDIAANRVGNAKKWDIVTSATNIDINKKKVQALKDDLVADGILTQARADEIFK